MVALQEVDVNMTEKGRFGFFIAAVAVFVACCPFVAAQPTQDVAAQPSQAIRFPVAHQHLSSWCFGYLYIDEDSIWYEVLKPAKDKNHEFRVKRSELQAVGRWNYFNSQTMAWDQKNAVELKFRKSTYHFWWLPEDQVTTGRPYQTDPPDAAAADTLIAAIRNPASVDAGGAASETQPVPATSAPDISGSTAAARGSSAGLGNTSASVQQTDLEARSAALERRLKAQAEQSAKIAEALGNSNGPSQSGSNQPIASTAAPSTSERQGAAFGHNASPPSSPTSLGQDAWEPDSKVGDLQFNVPNGWKQVQAADGIALVPSGASPNSVVIIGFLPGQTVGDPYSWFRAAWANWKTQINLIDSGEPETKNNANGFDVLRSYSRAYHPRLGNATFILAAAVAGNRVAPYFYLCNSNCGFDGYQNDFQTFELSLTLGSLTSSAKSAASGGKSGGLKGLYTSFSTSEGHPELGTFRVRGSITYLAFFPDGNVIRFLPKEGLENFDLRSAVRSSRESCGRYQLNGNRLSITWGDNSVASGVRDGAKLQIGDGSFEYEPTAHSDGLNLSGIYRPDGADWRVRLAFLQDGRFVDDGALSAVDIPSAPGLGNSYRINDNTLTLSYSDGRIVKVSFFISGDEEGSPHPSTVHVNGHALLRIN
ncbi:MAG TPA: hypothetical protein VKW06_16400 [Candidatus Angelobacter sp.]|nr:hypothetical protein [Candidatus Angelobacter sp.]